MALYAAVASLKQSIGSIECFMDILFPPDYLQTLTFIMAELRSIQDFLGRVNSSSRERMYDLLTKIAQEIREFEGQYHNYLQQKRLQDLKQDFLQIVKKVDDLKQATSSKKSKMIGFFNPFCALKENLVSHLLDDTVVFVVGMAGIGKTTLATEFFEDLDALEWFDVRVWVTLGTELQSEEITQAILAQVDPDAHDHDQPAERLKQRLEGKRYLIVLDDVWDLEFRDCFTTSFPVNGNGSRVLLTTRIRFLAEGIMFSSHTLEMSLMGKDESWDLLCHKVFGEELCPRQLEKAGKKIAEKCDGLPLTIVTVADLLSKDETDRESLWIEVASKKKHQLFIKAYDQVSKVLLPIYEKLSEDFKLCFLYIGVFPQNHEITKSKLVNLWIVEEVIELLEFPTIEDSAKVCWEYLAFCSFVMIYQTSDSSYAMAIESVKSCGLHSSWWHFCQREARKTNFFHVLDCYDDGFGDGIKGQSRLSIHNNVLFGIKDVYDSMEENCAFTAHSLLCFGPYHQYQVPLCFGLKLLQKLDALNIRFYEFPMEVLELIKLRYLALTFNGNLPPSICKLLKLQFLFINRNLSIKSGGSQLYLPMEIWDLIELKHLEVMGCDLPDLGHSCLRKLLKLLNVSNDSCTRGVFERTRNLKKLGIRIELAPNVVEPLSCFDHISHLKKLESLTCVVVNPECTSKIAAPLSSFPLNLHKLNLSGLGYPWKEMNKIGASLPHLWVLKLKCNAFSGPEWEVEKDGFQSLRFLLLEDLDLVRLKVTRGSFLRVEYINIRHCYKLKGLSLEELSVVEKVEVLDCNPLVVKDIKESQLRSGRFLARFRIGSTWGS